MASRARSSSVSSIAGGGGSLASASSFPSYPSPYPSPPTPGGHAHPRPHGHTFTPYPTPASPSFYPPYPSPPGYGSASSTVDGRRSSLGNYQASSAAFNVTMTGPSYASGGAAFPTYQDPRLGPAPGAGYFAPPSPRLAQRSAIARPTPPPGAKSASQQFGHYRPPSRNDPPEQDFEGVDDSLESRNRPKTPPDCTSTTEWRKGPAGIRSLCNACGLNAAKRAKDRKARGFTQPTSVEHIKQELISIGAERFKSVDGNWTLPPNTTERIYATFERTEKAKAQLALPKATKKSRQMENNAAKTLLAMSRGEQPPAVRPPSVTRRGWARTPSTALHNDPSRLPS
ncbi:GATA-binding transcription factor [Pseudohyphozyma bogoriensis]|nr:GATA-binding transcription factor [Pseudohyphozyma bogoriensis]